MALTQLIGIVANEGRVPPSRSVASLQFEKVTHYETRFDHASVPAQTVLAPAIADAVRAMLRDVVQGGTAKPFTDGMAPLDSRTLEIYGTTGTGDQRFNLPARGARLIESRKVNRTATFVFGIDDRFFGTLTASVHEPYAARYDFTRALAVQMLKSLGPALSPLLNDAGSAPVVASSLRYNDAIRAQSSN